ncbi:response regulator [bacterium]|nr:response regulator [bacterium]
MNILIIDDNAINVKVLENILGKSFQCQPVSYLNPLKAMEWCATADPDMVFVDYMMPDMDGLQFIEAFRQLPDKSETPIVMITAAEDKSVRYKALELGANDFLNKPIDKSELIARTRNMWSIRQSQKQLQDRANWLDSEIRRVTKDIIEKERDAIFRLSRAAEYRSPETGLHVMRVALYSRALAKKINLPSEDQELIFVAASMHDIGKVGTPDNILYKSDKLDQYEFALMKLHTLTGYEIMQNSTSKIMQMAADIAIGHHEKFDGTGYPKGLTGERIPLAARICAIADVFDALTSDRAYKQAWSIEQAIEELDKQSGKHFDPFLVQNFKTLIPEISQIRSQYSAGRMGEMD